MSTNQKPEGRRFRPLLRMNDLLHPIQQRERMDALLCLTEVDSTYSHYPRLWSVTQASVLLVVKAPGTARWLDEETYLVLLQQRVSWMMHSWMQELQSSQMELERLLQDTIAPLHTPHSDMIASGDAEKRIPSAKQRCHEWAKLLVHHSDRILDTIHLENVQFPVHTWDSSHPQFEEICELHDATELETWLGLLA